MCTIQAKIKEISMKKNSFLLSSILSLQRNLIYAYMQHWKKINKKSQPFEYYQYQTVANAFYLHAFISENNIFFKKTKNKYKWQKNNASKVSLAWDEKKINSE
jgi:hypothetical protein